MYDYIKGQLDRLTPAAAVVEAGGVVLHQYLFADLFEYRVSD